jgi:hypothetical protein
MKTYIVIGSKLAKHEYLFDVKLFASIRVKAHSERGARKMIERAINCNTANLGEWPNGDPILCEVSLDDNPDNNPLIEVDGEKVD